MKYTYIFILVYLRFAVKLLNLLFITPEPLLSRARSKNTSGTLIVSFRGKPLQLEVTIQSDIFFFRVLDIFHD